MNGRAAAVGVWLAVLAALGFSFKAIFVKLAYPYGVGAATLLALRMLFSLPAFVVIGLRASRSAPPLTWRDGAAVTALGLLGYYGASIFDFIGLQYISAGLERLLLFTYPTLTLLIGVVFLGKPLDRRSVVALALCYVGIGLAFAHDLGVGGDWRAVAVGSAFVFASSLCYALYLSGSGEMILRLGAARFTALAMGVSTAAALVHFALTEPLSALAQPWPVIALAAGMSLLSTVLPVFMQSASIRRIGASRSALIGTLGPVLTILFAWLLLDEHLSFHQLAGAALVVAGIVLVGRGGK